MSKLLSRHFVDTAQITTKWRTDAYDIALSTTIVAAET